MLKDILEQVFCDPQSILGLHQIDSKWIIRVFNSFADKVFYICDETGKEYELKKEFDGLFTGDISKPGSYKLKFVYDNYVEIKSDPYSFPSTLSEYDLHLFNEGTHRKIWEMMGAHIVVVNNVKGVRFCTWAPNARSVRIIGEFNSWDKSRYFMQPCGNSGIWELFVPDIVEGCVYKYVVETSNDELIEKSDPYAFYSEKRPATGSIVYDLDNYLWEDDYWMKTRSQNLDRPMSIYECHLSSWLHDHEGDVLTYSGLAPLIAEYLLEHGFTHVELMPVTEYPYDLSWGYQVTGYYAPTSRYGTPDEFMFFVDYLHRKGIGVIIDWVPGHFPADQHGLAKFDGTALYEHEDPRLGWHQDWKTYIFNYGRYEVRQFLIGSALYWLEKFHVDGIRVDAVASMIYLDYSRNPGEWVPNRFGGRENLDAIEFLQSLNTEIKRFHPTAVTIAEESTSFRGVTADCSEGGLGFTYKWNMGWMNDTLRYFSVDPLFRSWHHNEITFSIIYGFDEKFILPFSHDEVVHGKGSLLQRMPGGEWEKFANLRLMYSYMWAHPGKKLLFAGQEWAPWNEWSESSRIEWYLNEFMLHAGIRKLILDLNTLYKDEPALYQTDHQPSTFSWIDCDNYSSGLLIFIRKDASDNIVLVVLNLNTVVKTDFRVGIPYQGRFQEIFNSDKSGYGGANILNSEVINIENIPHHHQQYSLNINVGPLAAVMFKLYR
ncbi:MAG: 1,4-alpha-glucan branching protein GlgB [Brevinemataceae bacterium]